MNKSSTERIRNMVFCALFAALSAVLSQISIPVGAVPITFTHISIFVASGLLGAKYGTVSQCVFVLLGAAGVPVFSGFAGGIGVILGPTGGFIAGYIGCAFITGFIADRFGRSVIPVIWAIAAGWIVTYFFGILWIMYLTNTGFIASLSAYMIPFLPGDIVKTIISVILINRLYPVIKAV